MYAWNILGAFVIALLLMWLGCTLMIAMKQILSETILHHSAFAMRFAGICVPLFRYEDIKQKIINK